jgi:hypothetical protein
MSARSTVEVILRQWATEKGANPETAVALMAAVRMEYFMEAAGIAHDEGTRLYDDMGQKAAQGAWRVSDRLRVESAAPMPELPNSESPQTS